MTISIALNLGIISTIGITLITLGIIAAIVFAILSVLYVKRHSSQLPASLLIGFMISQIFFDIGLAFYLGYIYAKLG